MNLVLGAVLLTGCSWAGVLWGRQSQHRVRRLREFQDALETMEAMIRYGWPLPQIYDELAQSQPVFSQIQKNGWSAALQQETMLTTDDREWIAAFGAGLGKTGEEGQTVHFALYRKRLESCLAQAEAQRLQKSRLCRNLGLLAGLAAVLMVW